MYNKTIEQKGSKSVDALHSGNDKKHFTVVASFVATGEMLKTMIIFRGEI